MRNRIYFQGVVQDKETKEETIKRKQLEFLASYSLYKQSKIQ
tara:strand:- start:319 stop:444 length:126 start_codon:yes stop_codon:yes gene_type:complete